MLSTERDGAQDSVTSARIPMTADDKLRLSSSKSATFYGIKLPPMSFHKRDVIAARF